MENFDSLFQEQRQTKDQPFDKAAWSEQKRQERRQLFETIDVMADKTLSDADALSDYLDMQSKLGKTSVGNTLLVLEADSEYTRDDGSIGVGFKSKTVFDVSQTYGQHLRERTRSPIKSLLLALMTDTPVPVKLSDSVSQDIGALYSQEDKTVYVAHGLDGNSLFKLIACELAHAEMNGSDPQMAGFVSSCAASIVCKRYGVDAPEDVRIPETISNMSSQDKRSILGKIRETACDMNERIDGNLFAQRQQQRGQDNQQR